MSDESGRIPVDTLIRDAVIVTMNAEREVFRRGAVAIRGRDIVAVGQSDDVAATVDAARVIDGRRFVVTPGLVNAHIHITGETLTRGFVPDDCPFDEQIITWLRPLYELHDETDEHVSAKLAAVEMLRTGTTTFLEAGTIWHVDAVVDALVEVGIRARIGRRAWDLPDLPPKYRMTTDEAIAGIEDTLARHGDVAGGRIKAWSMLVGHTTSSDPLWRAARELATAHGTGFNFHMSPAASDPAGFLAVHGERPIVHLDRLGVLADDTMLVHCVHVDDHEVALLGRHRCNVAHCPTTALKVAYGVTQIGRMPEMVDAGVNLCIGTDGSNAGNSMDMMRATYLVAGLFKDARNDPAFFPAEQAFAMATIGGARGLRAADEIGSLEVGKRADLVLHDRERPEWVPLLDVANQLVWSADGRGVHTVFVDGRVVVEDYRMTTVDEERLYALAQERAESIVRRTGLQKPPRWKLT